MKKEETYPNYSVYSQEGGQLKIPYCGRKRVKLYNYDDALAAAARYWRYRKGRVDILILKYVGPYDSTITNVLTREENGSTSEHIL